MAITTPMPAANAVFTLAEVRMPRMFRMVKTSAKKIAHPQYGTPGANLFAC